MYNKLLISAGGGIISHKQQAEQNECATIAIGLGGTGVDCLRALKQEVYNRLKPDQEDSPVPSYQHIKFLAVDADRSSLASNNSIDALDANTEFMDLSCADISALLAGAAVLKHNPSLQWLKASATQRDGNGISIQNAKAGAGGVPQIGRLLLLQNCTRFVAKLTAMITEAKRELRAGAEINIHIFSGMGGGTGSGTFLDVCYLVQHVLGNLGLQGVAQTCGYFFMPDVNLDRVADPKIQECIKSNGFARMKELDYCMNFDINGGEWNQIYDGFSIKTQNPPVDLAYLITATNENGAIRANAYDYAMHVVVDYVMDFMTKPDVPADSDDKNSFTTRSYISNIQSLITMVNKKHGAGYNYCALGASSAYLPYKEITTYLTSKIFEGFGRLNHQLPGDNDIDLLVHNIGLPYEEILRALNDRVPPILLYAVDTKTIYEQTEGITSDVIPQVLVAMRDTTSKVSGQLTENVKAMLDEFDSNATERGKSVASLITRVRNELLKIAAQPEKGPYYAGAVLYNVRSHDLQNIIAGYIDQNDSNISKVRADLSLRAKEMENALMLLQNSNAFNRKGRGKDYVAAVNAYYRQNAKIDLYSHMSDVLVAFKKQINDLYTRFFGIFENVLRNLEATFSADLSALAKPVAEDNGYAVKLMKIQDLQKSLDDSVKSMSIDDLISGFTDYMLKTPDVWIAQDENKIAYAVSAYFLGQLEEFTDRTIVDYLQIKYNTTEPQVLAQKVYDGIFMPLADKAAPLFWVDGSKYKISETGELGFCTLPQISPEILAAAQQYHKSHLTTVIRPSFNIERISFLISKCGIPMYGYKGVDNYRSAHRVIGAHLYEAADGDERDWRALYSITPYSCVNDSDCSESLKVKAAKVEKAEQYGVLKRHPIGTDDTFDYRICILDGKKMDDARERITAAVTAGDVEKAEALQQEFKSGGLPVASERTIKNVGAQGCEDTVVKDLLIASQYWCDILEEEVGKLEKHRAAIAELDEFVRSRIEKAGDVQTFAGALCTGVITFLNEFTYLYVKESFGLAEKVELTTIESTPFGEYLPFYSAFVGFSKLDESVKSEIAAAVKNKKINCRDELPAAVEKAKALIVPDKMNQMAARAQKTFSSDYRDVVGFLKDVAFEIQNF